MAISGMFKGPTLGGALGALGSIYTGISAFNAAGAVAEDLRFEGEVVFREAIRTANVIREEGMKFAAAQSLQYIGSGVQLAGSALVTIAQTEKFAETEASAVEARGGATKSLAERSARVKENEGRAALVGGIVGGVTSLLL